MVKSTYSMRPQAEEAVGPASHAAVARIAKFVLRGEGDLNGIHHQVLWETLKEIEAKTNVPKDYFVGFEITNPVTRANRLQTRFASIKKLKEAKEAGSMERLTAIVVDSGHDLDIRNDAAWEAVEIAQASKDLETFIRTVSQLGQVFGGALARAGQEGGSPDPAGGTPAKAPRDGV